MRALAVVLIMCLTVAAPVQAEPAAGFLNSMAGTWRGKGRVYISKKSENAQIRCKITSTLNKIKRKLSNKGRCATAQRKVRVSGAIGYSAGNNRVSGSYLGALGNTVITRSFGTVNGNQLTLDTTFLDEKANRVTQARSVIRRLSKRKFTVTLFEKDGGSYLNRGKITFTR